MPTPVENAVQWLRANPNATQADLEAARVQAGISKEQLDQILVQAYPLIVQQDVQKIFADTTGQPSDVQLRNVAQYLRSNNVPSAIASQAAQQFLDSPQQWTPQQVSDFVDYYAPTDTLESQQGASRYKAVMPQQDQYGLSGAESALNEGRTNALGSLADAQKNINSTYAQALAGSKEAQNTALGQIGKTQDAVTSQYGKALAGLSDAQNTSLDRIANTQGQVNQFYGQGANDLRTGAAQGQQMVGATQGQVSGLFDRGNTALAPFADTGKAANQLQGALSGALGPEAQKAAFQNYQESPGVDFARSEAERAITRNAAAIGGLGGGNVRDQLARNAVGTYLQDFNNQYARLGDVSNRGYSAAANQGTLAGQEGGIQASLGQYGASIPVGASQQLAGLSQNQAGTTASLGQYGASVPLSVANTASNLYSNLGNTTASLGQYGASIPLAVQNATNGLLENKAAATSSLGQYGANLSSNYGGALAGYRYGAGQDIANALSGSSNAIANLINQQGAGQSDLIGSSASDLNALYQNAANGDVAAKQQLAALLANISSQSASQYSGVPLVQGQPSNYLGQLGQVSSGIGGLLAGLRSTGGTTGMTSTPTSSLSSWSDY